MNSKYYMEVMEPFLLGSKSDFLMGNQIAFPIEIGCSLGAVRLDTVETLEHMHFIFPLFETDETISYAKYAILLP